jgi:cytochrome c553
MRSRTGYRWTGTVAVTAALAAVTASGAAWPADVAAGREKARQCAACHGLDGMSRLPDAPNIGGESSIYLERQLRLFRSGERQHPQMSIIAQGLSDEDISDLSAYYGAIEIEVTSVPE